MMEQRHREKKKAKKEEDGKAATDNEPRIFIIHAGEDKDSFVRPFVNNIQQQGLAEKDIFFDDVSIKPGEVIRDRIISTLSSHSLELAVIVVSTSLLNKYYWPKLEWETCLRNNKPIFPIWVDANNDKFKAFSELVGKYSPTLKQMRARCVQRNDVTDELPNIATELVRQLRPGAIQTLVYLAPSPSSSESGSSDEDQGICTASDDDAQRVRDKLKDKKAEQLELLKTLGGIDMGFLSQASQEGLMSKEQIAQMTGDMIRDIHQDGLRIIKVKMGCAIIHLVPNSLAALDAFWRDYESGKLSTDFSQYLITDEMHTAVGKDLFIRVIVLEEQYRQWKHYFEATDAAETVEGVQSLSIVAPASSATFKERLTEQLKESDTRVLLAEQKIKELRNETEELKAQLSEKDRQLTSKDLEIQAMKILGRDPFKRHSSGFSRHVIIRSPRPSSAFDTISVDSGVTDVERGLSHQDSAPSHSFKTALDANKPRVDQTQEVYCHPYISKEDVAFFIREHYDRLPDDDRKLLQHTMTLVTIKSLWVWTNAQITVLGPVAHVVFYSGDRTNKFVVHLNSQDAPTYVTEHRGWRLLAKDGDKKVWGWVKRTDGGVFRSITGESVESADPGRPIAYTQGPRSVPTFEAQGYTGLGVPELPDISTQGPWSVPMWGWAESTDPRRPIAHTQGARSISTAESVGSADSRRASAYSSWSDLTRGSVGSASDDDRVHEDREQHNLPFRPSQTMIPDAFSVDEDRQQDRLHSYSFQSVSDASRVQMGTQQDSSPSHPSQDVSDGRSCLDQNPEVHCAIKIKHRDIARFIQDHHDSLRDKDLTLLRGAMDLVIEKSDYVWENAQLTVYCSTMHPVFYSGNRSNKYELYLNAEDRPTHVAVNREIRLKLQDGATAILTLFVKTASNAMARTARP